MKDDLNKTDSSMEEIAEYYLNLEKEKDTSDETTEDEFTVYQEKTSDPIKETLKNFNFDDNENTLKEELFNKKNIIFFSSAFACALIILLIVFIAGTMSDKAEEDINFELAHMVNDSKEYTQYERDIEKARADMDALTKEISIKQAELDTLTDFESNTGTMKSQINVLNAEMEELNDSLAQREKTLKDLEASISKKLTASFTLTPGIYTVGKNINAGNFEVSGDGILTVSDANGKLRVNTNLFDEPAPLQLKNGDILKIETKADFLPKE